MSSIKYIEYTTNISEKILKVPENEVLIFLTNKIFEKGLITEQEKLKTLALISKI